MDERDCDSCCFCKMVRANCGWGFPGCYAEPYKGKWTAEIKVCPLKSDKEKNEYFY